LLVQVLKGFCSAVELCDGARRSLDRFDGLRGGFGDHTLEEELDCLKVSCGLTRGGKVEDEHGIEGGRRCGEMKRTSYSSLAILTMQ
jgi:hypothetical protein